MNFQNISAGPKATQIIQVKAEDPRLQPSFFKTSSYESYKNINPERVKDTCLWFLNHETFLKWRDSNNEGLLWVSADPGCGKSVLSRALIDEKLLSTRPATICYFFFKDNNEQNKIATALCALLHQFFCAHPWLLKKHVSSAKERCGDALKNDFEELWWVFESAATDENAGEVICILDALDECRQSDRNTLVTRLERFYKRLVNKSEQGSKLKFLVTSRPYHNIERALKNMPTIQLAGEDESEQISQEIAIVIDVKVEEIARRRKLSKDVQVSLRKQLSEIPNRTYLWLHLTLDQVEKGLGKTGKKLREAIDRLPTTVEEAYEKILARCEQENEQKARRVLYLIVAARRPLTLAEIDVALAIEFEPESTSYKDLDLEGKEGRKEWIRQSCGLFVSVVDSRIFLIHQTAREFLIQKNKDSFGSPPSQWKHSVDLQRAHKMLAEISITHLFFREFQEPLSDSPKDDRSKPRLVSDLVKEYTRKNPFLRYSAKHWLGHMKEADIDCPAWLSKAAKLCDLGDGWHCPIWYRIFKGPRGIPAERERSALYWAAGFGLPHVIRYLLEKQLASNERSDDITLALYNALQNRDMPSVAPFFELRDIKITEDVVESIARSSSGAVMAFLLEQRGAEIKITEDVLVAAAWNQKLCGEEVMAVLLKERGNEVKITEEVLVAAALNRENGVQVMRLLLEQRGDEIKITEKVLERAAENDTYRRELLALLLEWREEVKITERVLVAAASKPFAGEKLMALLLKLCTDEVKITEKVLESAARNWANGGEIIALFLKERRDDVMRSITPHVFEAASRNEYTGDEIIALLGSEDVKQSLNSESRFWLDGTNLRKRRVLVRWYEPSEEEDSDISSSSQASFTESSGSSE